MAKNAAVVVEMPIREDKKSVVKFSTNDKSAPVSNVYIVKTTPGVAEAKSVKVTVEVG